MYIYIYIVLEYGVGAWSIEYRELKPGVQPEQYGTSRCYQTISMCARAHGRQKRQASSLGRPIMYI